MLGRFNQRPSIKTTPAQCPAAAKGFILCAMQELYTADKRRQTVGVGPPSTTLDQRHTKSIVERSQLSDNYYLIKHVCIKASMCHTVRQAIHNIMLLS